MNERTEAGLIDYIVVGLIGFAIGQAIAGVGGFQTLFSGFAYVGSVDWGRAVTSDIITGIFAFLPAGFVAGYLCYKQLKAEEDMAGLTGGVMTFVVYFIITLIVTLAETGIWAANFGDSMGLWAILMVFALVFFSLGGFLAGWTRRMSTPLPSYLKFQFMKGRTAPPPPPPGASTTCPSCGGPLRYIEQYKRWYCDKENKYV